jgi:hypothetical protein
VQDIEQKGQEPIESDNDREKDNGIELKECGIKCQGTTKQLSNAGDEQPKLRPGSKVIAVFDRRSSAAVSKQRQNSQKEDEEEDEKSPLNVRKKLFFSIYNVYESVH